MLVGVFAAVVSFRYVTAGLFGLGCAPPTPHISRLNEIGFASVKDFVLAYVIIYIF